MEHASSLPHKAWASLLLAHDDEDPLLLVNVLSLRAQDRVARDHVETLVEAFRGQSPTVEALQTHVEANDLGTVDVGDLAAIVAERLDFVRERGMGAMGPLMGVVMQAAQGADGKEVSALLRAAIQAAVE